jgi:plastocyanin
MSHRIFPTWLPFVIAALLFAVLLTGCTGAPSGQPPATTQATPAMTTPPATPAATTAATTVPTPAATTAVLTTHPVVTTTAAQTPMVASIAIREFAFVPESIKVPSGSTVIWTNQDSPPHSIISDATPLAMTGALFASGQLQQGQTYSVTFTKPGTYLYHCGVHSFMKGTITVT